MKGRRLPGAKIARTPGPVAEPGVAVIGLGESRVGRLRGMSALRLTLEAARSAMQDAGVAAGGCDPQPASAADSAAVITAGDLYTRYSRAVCLPSTRAQPCCLVRWGASLRVSHRDWLRPHHQIRTR